MEFVTFVKPITVAFKQIIYYVDLCLSSLLSGSSTLIVEFSFLYGNTNICA